MFARKDLLETTICLSNIATLKNGYAFQSGKYNALGKWKILTITNVSGERYINDEDYNCIINLPNDIQDHQVLKEGDILISLTGNVGRVSLCKDGDYLLVSIRPTTGIKPLYTTIATVTMNLIVSAAIVLLNPYVTIYISYKIPPFALSVHIPDVSTSIYVEVDSKVLLGLPFCDKAFVR